MPTSNAGEEVRGELCHTGARECQDHPLYQFWFAFLKLGDKAHTLFSTVYESHMPRQCVSLAFQWALEHGHVQLVAFFAQNLTLAQFEYLGLLAWRRMSFACKHTVLFEWLCARLCIINLYGMARTTWNAFYTSLHATLNDRQQLSQEQWTAHASRLSFLLEHCCDRLRWALVRAQKYRALNALLMYRDRATIHLFIENLNVEQLRKVVTVGFAGTRSQV